MISINIHKIFGSILAGLGFLLSPLSWWNDLIVNIPLAYLIASVLTYAFPGYFSMFMILAYWLTNVLGLLLMHKGGKLMVNTETSNTFTIKSVVHDLNKSRYIPDSEGVRNERRYTISH